MLDKFFIGDTLQLDWDYIDSIPEMVKLKDCEQNPKWHGEGTAYEHTKKCVEAAYKLYSHIDTAHRIALVSVLLHDIGKAVTTTFEKGAWHAYGHEFAGERIARRILWNEPIWVRETICSAIRHHMEPLRVADAKNADILKKLIFPTFNEFFSWELTLFVKQCDILGSVPEDDNETQIGISKISWLSEILSELHILNKNLFDETLYRAAVLGKKEPWIKSLEQKVPEVIVLIGMPGAGKNTWIEEFRLTLEGRNDYVVISRDDIRSELGFCEEGEKVVLSHDKEEQVSKVFNERFIKAISEKKNVILNNINLRKTYRDAYKELLQKHGIGNIKWIYIYIEADSMETLLQRRPTIQPFVYKDLIDKFDFPQPGEYDIFNIVERN